MNLRRRRFLKWVKLTGIVTVAGITFSGMTAHALSPFLSSSFTVDGDVFTETNNLSVETLVKNLYPKTPDEEAFLAHCITLRDEGSLPDRLLYAAFRYAIKKNRERRFYSFRYAIVKLCQDRGVDLLYSSSL